jgi:hypothetical protein
MKPINTHNQMANVYEEFGLPNRTWYTFPEIIEFRLQDANGYISDAEFKTCQKIHKRHLNQCQTCCMPCSNEPSKLCSNCSSKVENCRSVALDPDNARAEELKIKRAFFEKMQNINEKTQKWIKEFGKNDQKDDAASESDGEGDYSEESEEDSDGEDDEEDSESDDDYPMSDSDGKNQSIGVRRKANEELEEEKSIDIVNGVNSETNKHTKKRRRIVIEEEDSDKHEDV